MSSNSSTNNLSNMSNKNTPSHHHHRNINNSMNMAMGSHYSPLDTMPSSLANMSSLNFYGEDYRSLSGGGSEFANPNGILSLLTTPTHVSTSGGSGTSTPEAVYCSRCRNYKKIYEFMDGDRRRKTCSSCRLYGKKYIKKKSLTAAPNGGHGNLVDPHTGLLMDPASSFLGMNGLDLALLQQHPMISPDALFSQSYFNTAPGESGKTRPIPTTEEEMILESRKFVDNMRWMHSHIERNSDNIGHLMALNSAFGKWIEDARQTIELELNHVNAGGRGSNEVGDGAYPGDELQSSYEHTHS